MRSRREASGAGPVFLLGGLGLLLGALLSLWGPCFVAFRVGGEWGLLMAVDLL